MVRCSQCTQDSIGASESGAVLIFEGVQPCIRDYQSTLIIPSKDIVIMHPGPINRGVELDSDVADSGQSIILDQVENGVAVRMAVLYLLSGRREANN